MGYLNLQANLPVHISVRSVFAIQYKQVRVITAIQSEVW